MPNKTHQKTNILNSFFLILHGFKDLNHKNVRFYVRLPIAINIILFGISFYFAADYLSSYLNFNADVNFGDYPWLKWLADLIHYILIFFKYLIIIITWLTVFIITAFIATIMANLIAAPFNGILSEKLDSALTGFSPKPISTINLITHSISRELSKIWYFLTRGFVVGFFAIGFYFIPGLQIISTILLFVFSAWMMGLEYLDFPADNHQVSIKQLRNIMRQNRSCVLSFGLGVALLSAIPIVNFFVMPAAVLAGTRLWVKLSRHVT